MNAIVQGGYNPVQMGAPSGAACPQGSIPTGVCTGNNIPQVKYLSGEIPVTNPANPGNLQQTPLSDIITQAFKDTQAQTAVTAFDVQCCPNPAPCQEQVYWRAQFKGCPYTYADDPALLCEVNPVGDRYMVADLEPLLFERRLMQQAEPNPYDFMNARQLWMQFLMKDWVQTRGDPYTRQIPNLDQSFCMQQNTKGPPQFTNM